MCDVAAHSFLPYGPAERRVERTGRDVVWLLQSPVVGCKGPGQSALTQCDDKVDQPEEHKQVTQMEDQDVAVVHTFSTVERKQTLWSGADFGNIGLTEGLK